MKRILFILSLLGALALLAAPGRSLAQAADPATVVRGQVDAFNTWDVEATVAYFADGAVLNAPSGPGGAPLTLTGKDQIRALLTRQFAGHPHTTIESIEVTGDTAQVRALNTSDRLRQAGLPPTEGTAVMVVQNGLIVSMTFKGPGTGAAPGAGAAPGMPATGANQNGPALPLLLIGLLGIAAGAAFRRAHPAIR